MKRAITFLLLMILVALPAFTQDGWIRVQEMEELFSMFEVDVEVWLNEETGVINFEDVSSKDFDEVLFQLSYIMTAFDFVLVDQGLSMQDSVIQAMVYSYFAPNANWIGERDDKYDSAQYHRYDIFMERQWLIDFFASSRRNRDDLLLQLYNTHYNEWFPRQQR